MAPGTACQWSMNSGVTCSGFSLRSQANCSDAWLGCQRSGSREPRAPLLAFCEPTIEPPSGSSRSPAPAPAGAVNVSTVRFSLLEAPKLEEGIGLPSPSHPVFPGAAGITLSFPSLTGRGGALVLPSGLPCGLPDFCHFAFAPALPASERKSVSFRAFTIRRFMMRPASSSEAVSDKISSSKIASIYPSSRPNWRASGAPISFRLAGHCPIRSTPRSGERAMMQSIRIHTPCAASEHDFSARSSSQSFQKNVS